MRQLSGSVQIKSIEISVGGVINPVTEGGFILAGNEDATPVRVSVVEEGGWTTMLEQIGVIVPPLLLLTSRAAPALVQNNEWLLVGGMESSFVTYLDQLPLALLAPLVVVLDALLAAFIAVHAVASYGPTLSVLTGCMALAAMSKTGYSRK
jgi:hypothetical protein